MEVIKRYLQEHGLASSGDKFVVAFGVAMGQSGHTDSLRIVTV